MTTEATFDIKRLHMSRRYANLFIKSGRSWLLYANKLCFRWVIDWVLRLKIYWLRDISQVLWGLRTLYIWFSLFWECTGCKVDIDHTKRAIISIWKLIEPIIVVKVDQRLFWRLPWIVVPSSWQLIRWWIHIKTL